MPKQTWFGGYRPWIPRLQAGSALKRKIAKWHPGGVRPGVAVSKQYRNGREGGRN